MAVSTYLYDIDMRVSSIITVTCKVRTSRQSWHRVDYFTRCTKTGEKSACKQSQNDEIECMHRYEYDTFEGK